jgi:uncharacterized RDD family membrane protein YckC
MNNAELKIRRLLALLMDILILVALGGIIGSILYPWLIGLGRKTYLIGFAIALLYHGLTNSLLLAGQTPGKVVFKLKVVSKNGQRIGPLRSLMRSFLIVFCFFGESIKIPDVWERVLTYPLIPFLIALIYFAIFGPCCRSIHDIIFGTYVVEAANKEPIRCKMPFKHLFAVSILSAFFLVSYIIFSMKGDIYQPLVACLNKTHDQIMLFPNVKEVAIDFDGGKYTIGIQTIDPPLESHKLAVKSACALIKNLKLTDSEQEIETRIMRGYDMEIYHSWEVYENSLSIHDWLGECRKLSDEDLK